MRLGVVFGLALMLTGVGAIGASAQPGPVATEPIKLFEALMPTLTNPRCSNCHGGVNVFTPVWSIMKPIEGTDVNHLVGHDVQEFDGTVITTDWDLRND